MHRGIGSSPEKQLTLLFTSSNMPALSCCIKICDFATKLSVTHSPFERGFRSLAISSIYSFKARLQTIGFVSHFLFFSKFYLYKFVPTLPLAHRKVVNSFTLMTLNVSEYCNVLLHYNRLLAHWPHWLNIPIFVQ